MSKEIFNKNMAVFGKRFPQYENLVRNTKINTMYELLPTPKNIKTMNVKDTDVYIYDKEDPVQGVADNILSMGIHHCRFAIYLGFGLGYETLFHSEQLSQKWQTQNILIIEHDPGIIKSAMYNLDMTAFLSLPGVDFFIGHNEDELFCLLDKYLGQNQRFYLLRAMSFLYNMEYFELNKNYYGTVINAVRRATAHRIMYYGNDAKDSITGVENMFNNINEIINNPGINLLKDKFKGVPAVCVATGPSLDKNMHLLKGLEDKAVMIAADASLKPLLDKGLKPHMVTTLEREMAIVDLFKDIPGELYNDVYLCGCPVIFNDVYKVYKGPHIICYRTFDHFKWLELERGMLEIKLSSGNMNFKIAEYLGCDPIILIGQDLALQGNKTNATGAVLGTEQESYLSEPHMMVRGNYQDMIETTRSLNMMLEAYIVDVAGHKGTCINATEGGARISGTKLMTFAEAVSKYINSPRNVKYTLDSILKSFKPDPNDKKRILAKTAKARDDFKRSLAICEESLKWLSQIKEKMGDVTNINLKEVLSKCGDYKNRMISESGNLDVTDTWQGLFAHVSQSVFVNYEMYLNSMPVLEKDEDQSKIKALNELPEYFRTIGGLINVYIDLLGKVVDNAY